MKLADLDRAQEARAELAIVARLQARMADGEGLRVMLGSGQEMSEIGLSADYAASLRRDVETGLARRAAEKRAELAALGVEE